MNQDQVKKDVLSYETPIWNTADILRGVSIKDSNFPEYMMPMFALIMIESRIKRKINELEKQKGSRKKAIEEFKDDIDFNSKNGFNIYGYNKKLVEEGIDLKEICKNDSGFATLLYSYLNSYDEETKDLLGITSRDGDNKLDLSKYLKILEDKDVLFRWVKDWSLIDLTNYDNSDVTTLEEHIKRRWADISAETAGEQYTPNDVISLISLITKNYGKKFYENSGNINLYDMTCGGGNMLFGIEDKIKNKLSKDNQNPFYIITHGQEFNSSLYALAKIESRFRDYSKIEYGNTLTKDMFSNIKMNAIAANPPFGIDWKQVEKTVKSDKSGRFNYYPSVEDGQLLFLQHGIDKLTNDKNQLSLACIISNGSTLFSGDSGSGESEIRRWILDNDYLEALIQLPTNEFFNTDIATYIWVINKNKSPEMKNKIKLINASEMFTKLKKNKGKKNKEIDSSSQLKIVNFLMSDKEDDFVKIFDKSFFYYNKQKIKLFYKDIFENSFIPKKNGKLLKSLKYKNIKQVKIKSKNCIFEPNSTKTNFNLMSNGLKDFSVKLNQFFSVDEDDLIITLLDGTCFTYDKEKESLVKIYNDGYIENLGCGKLKFKTSYKKSTKTKKEHIDYYLELYPKTENDYETIPFSFEEKKNSQNIQYFINKWVEKDCELLENSIGVEINFNKVFHKEKFLYPFGEIKNKILSSNNELNILINEVFND